MKRLFFITLSLFFILGCKNDSSDSSQTPVVTKTETPKEEVIEIKKEEPDIWSTPISFKDIKGYWVYEEGDVKFTISIGNLTFSSAYLPESKIEEYKYLKTYYGYSFFEDKKYYSKYISTDNIGIWARKLQINQKLNKMKNAEFGSEIILKKLL